MRRESRADGSDKLGRYCWRVEERREIRWEGKVASGVGRGRKAGAESAVLLALADGVKLDLVLDLVAVAVASELVAGKMFLYMEMVATDCSRKISM
jgi:hypothetical protein